MIIRSLTSTMSVVLGQREQEILYLEVTVFKEV
jgi:hypothetical protein